MQNEMGGALNQGLGAAGSSGAGKSGDQAAGGVQPSFSYLIADLIMFQFADTLMLLTTNELGHCQLFDAANGVLQHSFVFDQSFGSHK